MSVHSIRINVNGVDRERHVPARLTLADFLREHLDLTATHLGCEHGVCGACTVLVEDEAARACLILAIQVDGSRVTTLEGLGEADELTPLQQAFWEKHGLQCGFCTPGLIMTATELLRDNSSPSKDHILEAVGGHLCRCTGYVKIIEAIEEAARVMGAER